jgi:hypothetical protein
MASIPSSTLMAVSPARPTANATLESLPAELRHEILSRLSDLEDLRALVLASRVFYQQYLHGRRAVLGRVLTNKFGRSLVDAYAVQKSASLYDSVDHQHLQSDDIRLFLADYAALRTAAPDLILQRCTKEDLVDMAGFYHSLARPLILQSAASFCHHFDPSLEVGELSRTEQMRFLRALYRLQLYCHLFGQGPKGHRIVPRFWLREILTNFFGLFQPWEIQEIHCIHNLVEDKYEEVFLAIQEDVSPDHPKFSDWRGLGIPPGAFNFGEECEPTFDAITPLPSAASGFPRASCCGVCVARLTTCLR